MNKKIIDVISSCENINMEIDDEVLVVNFFCKDQKDINMNFIQKNNSHLIINMLSIVKSDTKVNIKSKIIGNNNKCIINVNAIAEKCQGTYNVCVNNVKDTKDNEIVENLRGLLENGTLEMLPILETDSLNVIASHFLTTGPFNKDELFYIMCKGINEENAKNLLKKGFIYNLFSTQMQEKIKKELNDE